MKKRSILALILALTLVLSSMPLYILAGEAEASNAEASDIKSEIPYCDYIDGVSVYHTTVYNMMTAEEAAAANVPEGYSGHVMKLTNSVSGVGLTIDPALISGEEIKLANVEAFVVRAYLVGSNVYSNRATVVGTSSWFYKEDPAGYDQWIEFSIPAKEVLAYEDGETVSPFCLAFRMTAGEETTVYVDSVTVVYKEAEEVVDPNAVKEEIPFCDNAGEIKGYGGTQVLMNEKLAVAAGVPAGYEGYVMSVYNADTANNSIFVDLRQTVGKGVKIADVESVTFRVWAPSTVSSLRLRTVANNNWQVNVAVTPNGEWIDFEVSDMSKFVDDGEGYFSPFVFAFRATDGTKNTCYIDSITLKLKQVEPETTTETEEPVEPETTTETEEPVEPETTTETEKPVEPETTTETEEPVEPETTTETEIPEETEDPNKGKSEIPYCDYIEGLSVYHTTVHNMMTADEAAAAGVPEGYIGHVMKVTNNASGGAGLTLDPALISGEEIKLADVKAFVVRAYLVGSNVYSNRATVKETDWFYQQDPAGYDQWIEYSIPANDVLLDDDGESVAPFCLAFRMTANEETTIYIDSVTVVYMTADDFVDPDAVKEEIPFCDNAGEIGGYGGTQVLMNEKLAAEAGVPAGYEGYVMSVSNANSANNSIFVDLRQTVGKGVKIADVESVIFRVWAPSNVSSLRLRTVANNNWQVNVAVTPNGEWIDFEVSDMSKFVDDGEGYFSPFVFAFRGPDGTRNNTCYIDSITLKLKSEEPDNPEESDTPEEPELEKPYYTFEEGMGKDEIPYGADDHVGSFAGYSNFMMMDEEQAKAAGVPEGFTGWVLAVDPKSGSNISIGLNLTSVRVKDIARIKIRVWCPKGTKQDEKDGGIRLTGNGVNSWNVKLSPTALQEWIDLVYEIEDYSKFDFDGDGYCDPTNFYLRYAAGTAYIDYITFELRDPDTEAPVITYDGETTINTTAGKVLSINVSAYDEYEKEMIKPEYIFSEGAVDENGLLLEGEHTCTVKFTDFSGNSSEIKLTLKVAPKDTAAPTLSWSVDKLYANAGMRVKLDVTATDNSDGEVDVVMTWSEGALDSRGRLIAGEHTLTLTAVDLTGNKTEKVISVIVTSGLPSLG